MKIIVSEKQLNKLVTTLNEQDSKIGSIIDLIIDKVKKSDTFGKDRKKKLSTSPEDKKETDYQFSETSSTDANNLLEKIKSNLPGTPNDSLAAALVANAYGESKFKCNSKGDGGEYAQNKPESINFEGKKYCSFGLWQFNICGGLGVSLLKKFGGDKSVLSDCNRQIDFMTQHIKDKHPNYKENHSIGWWIDWIVDNVERPANKEGAKRERREWAKKTFGQI
jgi:hypothetical protein